MQLTLDTDPPAKQAVQEIVTRPCSVKLSRCDIVVSRPTPRTPIEVNVVVNRTSYDLRTKDTPKGEKATSTTRSLRSVSQNVNLFQDSSSYDTASEATVQPLGAAIKREPSLYRLAAHKYMVASRRGIITGPKVRTCASTISKQEAPTNENPDSDATVIVEDNIKPPVPNKKKKLPDITKTQETKPSKKRLLPKLTSYKKEALPPNQRKKGGSPFSSV